MPIRNRIAEWQEELTAWRHDLHRHPELRWEETRTASLVAERLRGFGCDDVQEGIARTGVVAVLKGRGPGPVLGFRADMDALPITEATGVAHASTRRGRMHACGHDGHTTMLLAAMRYLAETRGFDGTVVALFQPAEEGGGGARAMVEAGVFDRYGVEAVYGMHNLPGLPAGQFAIRPGTMMAAADFFRLTLRGAGGHAAMPHQAADTNLAAASLVVALQSIASRSIDAQQPVVVSVTSMRSDSDTYNVLPDKVELKGTVRYMAPGLGARIHARMEEIAEGVARTHGVTARLRYKSGVAPTVNTAPEAEAAARAAETVSDAVSREAVPLMAGEDFSDMLAVRPGAFMFLGNGDSAELHNPAYDFNDAILPIGASWFAALAEGAGRPG
ncbi:M20 aminoacylase family protein [Pseudoponticoccus marisrubri]|uniref:Amidohydrolase n=1 Tax=Pseudoponticoccus marisrubri TaxID=1685382 RepID=A0A0W7WLY9_9RHOB|nr:M20 aminoacylase family protein [Pseudoponticoccus marisrubri]KUF11512.1 amidohydrolase [Pseudoponticoccus marisrubri]